MNIMQPFKCGVSVAFNSNHIQEAIKVDFISLNTLSLRVAKTPDSGYRSSAQYDIQIADEACAEWDGVIKEDSDGDLTDVFIFFSGHTEVDTFTALFSCLGLILSMFSEGHSAESIAATIEGHPNTADK